MDRLLQNMRVGIRSLRRTPGFSVTALLTLALGIGLSAAVFTVASALLLRPLPVHDQDRVVALWGEKRDGSFDNYPVGLEDARDFTQAAGPFERVAWYAYEGAWPAAIRDGDRIARLRRARVSGEFFDVLGATPWLGRTLREADDRIGAAPVVVLSHGTWQQRFAGESDVLGRTIVLHANGVAYTIVGVMGPGFDLPRGSEFWTPIVPSVPPDGLRYVAVNLIGRLAADATAADAQHALTTWFTRREASVWQRELRGVAQPLPQLILGDAKPAVLVFVAACALLLLITCGNVANLLLVRGIARVQEIAVRSALGARRRHVVAQLVTENVVLAVAGGVLGLGVAAAAIAGFVAFAPADVPRLAEIRLDASALGGAVSITAVALLIFGLAPALIAARVDLQQVLRSDSRQSMSRRSSRVADVLVAGQLALALVVLSATGLVARSLINLERAELSFEPSRLLIAELAFRSDRFADAAKQTAFLQLLLPQIEALPGVDAVSPVVSIPFAGAGGWDGRLGLRGQSPEEVSANPMLNMEVVAPDYFSTLRTPVLQGRAFTEADRPGAPPVVIVSQSTARHLWPSGDAVGEQVLFGAELDRTFTVVGVVPDTRYRDLRDARPSVYFPLAQSFFPFAPTNLAIRTNGPPLAVVDELRRVIADTDAAVALAGAMPFASFLERPLAQPRLNALLLVIFGSAAVTVAAVGLFGVMMTMVRQRTRELGVRLALGATATDLRWLVLGRGLVIAAAGCLIGLAGALITNRVLAALLYEVSPTDGITLAVVTALLIAVAAFASLIPARLSARTEPVVALRA
jgi:predicted permease